MLSCKRLDFPAGLLFLSLLTACQTPTTPVMPPEPPDAPSAEAGERPENTPGKNAATVQTEVGETSTIPAAPATDFTLFLGKKEITLQDLQNGSIAPNTVITVVTNPKTVEYKRTLELLDEISGLGYQVRYQPASKP